MPESVSHKKLWIDIVLKYWPIIAVLSLGIWNGFKQYYKSDSVRENLNTHVEAGYEPLKEQVLKMYQNNRDLKEGINNQFEDLKNKYDKEIRELREWMEFQKGYEQSKKEYLNKP